MKKDKTAGRTAGSKVAKKVAKKGGKNGRKEGRSMTGVWGRNHTLECYTYTIELELIRIKMITSAG